MLNATDIKKQRDNRKITNNLTGGVLRKMTSKVSEEHVILKSIENKSLVQSKKENM